jgi:tRNA(fMet)-specific endonuclease VapC
MVVLCYLVDTNTWSDVIAPRPDREIQRRIRIHHAEIALAAPVLQELLFGVYRMPNSARRQELERHISRVILSITPVLPYDEAAAEWHAAERARLVREGLTPPFIDSQIAAIAAVNDLVVVTRNVRDYQHFQNLQVEDWSS